MKYLLLLPLLLLLSCNSNDSQIKKDIIGDWKFEKLHYTNKIPNKVVSVLSRTEGYAFLEGGKYENKLRFGWDDSSKDYSDERWHDWGSTSEYKIENDTLKLFNPVNKKWKADKIVSVTKDTLTLQVEDSTFAKYSRVHYSVPDANEKYDRIIVSSTGCFGTCPVTNTSISRNGDVLYYGEKYTTKDGYYTAKITAQAYNEIEERFKKANSKALKNEYYARHSDDRTVTVSFIKNGRIVKTITDYGDEAPVEFNWAYQPVLTLYQHLNLTPAKNKMKNLPVWPVWLSKEKKICTLEESELFYLFTELEKAKYTTATFKPEYFINYNTAENSDDYETHKIVTDGRFYKLPPEEGGKVLDLGYNFIERYSLGKRFR